MKLTEERTYAAGPFVWPDQRLMVVVQHVESSARDRDPVNDALADGFRILMVPATDIDRCPDDLARLIGACLGAEPGPQAEGRFVITPKPE